MAKILVAETTEGRFEGQLYDMEFSSELVDKLLYRPVKGANGTNLVATLIFTVVPNEDKYVENVGKHMTRVRRSLKNSNHTYLSEDSLALLENQLREMHGKLDAKKRYVFTIKPDGKWFGEYDAYRQLFEGEAYAKYYEGSRGHNQVCAVTYEESKEVWGRVDTLGFTVNDVAFARNGFQGKDSYKMFPVSPEVAKALEGTRRYVMEKHQQNFYSMRFFILPHFIQPQEEVIRKVLREFERKIQENAAREMPLQEGIISNERYVLEAIEKFELTNQDVYFDIFFYQQQQAQFLIKLHLHDVLPSRIRQIFEAKKQIEETYQRICREPFKNKDTGQMETRDFRFNFRLITPFYSYKVKTDVVFTPGFFKLLEAVFYGRPVHERTLLDTFLKTLRQAAKDPEQRDFNFPRLTKHSFAIYQFLFSLYLFKHPMTHSTVTPPLAEDGDELTLESFIAAHEASFFRGDEYKKGVFMFGCLTQILLVRQYKRLKNQPFFNKLNNLSIGEKEIQELLPQVINKLAQYEYRIPEMEGKIARAIVQPTEMTKTEISYTFTLGMVMQREFSKAFGKKLPKAEEEEEQTSELSS